MLFTLGSWAAWAPALFVSHRCGARNQAYATIAYVFQPGLGAITLLSLLFSAAFGGAPNRLAACAKELRDLRDGEEIGRGLLGHGDISAVLFL